MRAIESYKSDNKRARDSRDGPAVGRKTCPVWAIVETWCGDRLKDKRFVGIEGCRYPEGISAERAKKFAREMYGVVRGDHLGI